MKKVVGASATACLMMAALLTGCENKCGMKLDCDPCEQGVPTECAPAATSAQVARVTTITNDSSLPCIAVLPFQCVSDNPQSGILVADSLANSLSNIDGCVVYGPEVVTSQVKFKDGEIIDPVDVGRKMNASYVLTGRVTEYADANEGAASVGVTARLIDAKTGQEVWTARQYQEYMNGALGSWSDAVSNDLAMSIDLVEAPAVSAAPVQPIMPEPPVVMAPSAPVVAAVPLPMPQEQDEDEIEDQDDSNELVDLASNTIPLREEIRFNSDIEPWDFGLEEPESSEGSSSGPIGEEFGVVAGSPLTVRYGTPTLPTTKVGQILDQFEDSTPVRYTTPMRTEPVLTVASTEGTADISALAKAAAEKEITDKYEALPDVVAFQSKAPEVPVSSLYAMQGRANGDKTGMEYHYTGANPFADGPGRKIRKEESTIDSLVASELGTVAIHTMDGGSSSEPELPETLTAFGPESSDLFREFTVDAPGALPEFDLTPSAGDFMPRPPVAMDSESRPNLYLPTPLESMDASDLSAMAAPELPEEEEGSGEFMFMPEPLTVEPPLPPLSKEVMPSDDGSFKVTISAEQFLDDEAFDFFGSLSNKLEDLDDLEG